MTLRVTAREAQRLGVARTTARAPKSARRRTPAAESPLEALLALQIRLSGLPEPRRQYRFCAGRQWRSDLAYPAIAWPLLIEVDGATWTGGRHSRGAGIRGDCEKHNAAVLLGYRVLRFDGDMVREGKAVQVIAEALRGGRAAEARG